MLNRVLPLALAFCLIISCLPALPASASDGEYYLQGRYHFDEQRMFGDDVYFPYSFVYNGTTYDGFEYSLQDDTLWFHLSARDIVMYRRGDWSGGTPYVLILEPIKVSEELYSHFYNCTYPGFFEFKTGIIFGSQVFNFFQEYTSPDVSITVTATGCTMTDGSRTYEYEYSGTGVFLGLGTDYYSGLVYPVGTTFTVHGSYIDQVYYFQPVSGDYSSSLIIGEESYSFSSPTESPVISLEVTDSGATISGGGTSYTYSFSGTGTFAGFSLTSGGDAVYLPGQTYTLDGGSHTLFPVVDLVYMIPAGQYEAYKLVMTGEYNDLPSWPDLGVVPFQFMSSGSSYQSMSLDTYLPTGQKQLKYGQNAAYRYAAASSPAGFTQSSYAFIYVPTTQTVSKEFAIWFLKSFDLISTDPVDPVFTATINIWDSGGSAVLHTVSYSGSICPIVQLQVLENGCSFSCSVGEVTSWSCPADFYGFALAADSLGVSFSPGQIYDLPGGGSSSVIMDLYVVDSLPDEGQYRSGILGILERISDKLSQWVDSNISIPALGNIFSVIDFSSFKDFFADMYDNVRSLFGLSDLLNDPSGPFAWLLNS